MDVMRGLVGGTTLGLACQVTDSNSMNKTGGLRARYGNGLRGVYRRRRRYFGAGDIMEMRLTT